MIVAVRLVSYLVGIANASSPLVSDLQVGRDMAKWLGEDLLPLLLHARSDYVELGSVSNMT